MKEYLKVIGINLVVLGFLVFLFNTLSITAIQVFNWQKPKQYAKSHLFPNYRDNPEAALVHFTEYDNLTKGYYESFYGWRRPRIETQTINIDENGLRRTYLPEDSTPSHTVAFFGGSTMWGTGAPDFGTIPSFVAKKMPSVEAINFGETGYIAHQSLNLFMKHYFEGFRPDTVVFYDGVNDTWNKCRRELDSFSHSREHEMRIILKEGSDTNPESYLFTILPIKNLLGKIVRVIESRSREPTSFYDCHDNPKKAEQVARVLLSDWMIMKTLVEGYGGTFVSILQPHAYVSETKLDHLELDETLGWQYDAVYPVILELLEDEFSGLQDNFVDLRHSLDKEDYFYIDWCHLSPNGNELIAADISEVLQQKMGRTTLAQ